MKKVLFAFTAGASLFSLAACGGNADSEADSDDNGTAGDISFYTSQPDERALQGVIKNVQFQGTYIRCTVTVQETDLIVYADMLQNFLTGDRVALKLQESSIKGASLKQA